VVVSPRPAALLSQSVPSYQPSRPSRIEYIAGCGALQLRLGQVLDPDARELKMLGMEALKAHMGEHFAAECLQAKLRSILAASCIRRGNAIARQAIDPSEEVQLWQQVAGSSESKEISSQRQELAHASVGSRSGVASSTVKSEIARPVIDSFEDVQPRQQHSCSREPIQMPPQQEGPAYSLTAGATATVESSFVQPAEQPLVQPLVQPRRVHVPPLCMDRVQEIQAIQALQDAKEITLHPCKIDPMPKVQATKEREQESKGQAVHHHHNRLQFSRPRPASASPALAGPKSATLTLAAPGNEALVEGSRMAGGCSMLGQRSGQLTSLARLDTSKKAVVSKNACPRRPRHAGRRPQPQQAKQKDQHNGQRAKRAKPPQECEQACQPFSLICPVAGPKRLQRPHSSPVFSSATAIQADTRKRVALPRRPLSPELPPASLAGKVLQENRVAISYEWPPMCGAAFGLRPRPQTCSASRARLNAARIAAAAMSAAEEQS
jgi:hypothetical protein